VALLGVGDDRIAENGEVFANLLARVDGRVYYNLGNWYRALALLPAFSLNRGYMETMMGVEDPLPPELTDRLAPPPARGLRRVREYLRLGRIAAGLAVGAARLGRTRRRFLARLETAIGEGPDPAAANLTELAATYRRIEGTLLDKWDAPLVNDFLCMVGFGASRALLGKWAGDRGHAFHNDVMIGQGGIVSAEPARRIAEMGRIVRGDDAALAAAIAALLADRTHGRALAWQGAALVLTQHTWAQNAAAVTGWLAEAGARRVDARGSLANAAEARGVGDAATGAAGLTLPLLDDKLRQRLYRATRPDLAGPLLARQLPGFRKKGPLDLERVEITAVLKVKPGRRCVLAYTLHARHRASGQPVLRQVVGKVFRDQRGQRLLALQAQLYRHGFGPDAPDGIDVPQPLAYIPEMRMLVQARVPGETLDALTGRGGAGPAVARAAQALARLHSSRAFAPGRNGAAPAVDAPSLAPYTLADELRGLEDYAARLAELRPDAWPAVQALHAALLAWADRLPAPPATTPLHRDFYYSQLLFDGPRLHLIDFDLLAQGDPALDVANFSAHLAYLGLEQHGDLSRLAGDAARFLAAYCAARPPDEGFARRLAFYQAATWFRLLNVVAPRPALRHLFQPLLAHTQAALRDTAPELA